MQDTSRYFVVAIAHFKYSAHMSRANHSGVCGSGARPPLEPTNNNYTARLNTPLKYFIKHR